MVMQDRLSPKHLRTSITLPVLSYVAFDLAGKNRFWVEDGCTGIRDRGTSPGNLFLTNPPKNKERCQISFCPLNLAGQVA